MRVSPVKCGGGKGLVPHEVGRARQTTVPPPRRNVSKKKPGSTGPNGESQSYRIFTSINACSFVSTIGMSMSG